MSEPTLPLPAGDGPDDAAPATRRRTLLLLGGSGVVALGVTGVLVLTGSAEPEVGPGPPTSTVAAAATPAPTASPPSDAAAVTATDERRPGRDPFSVAAGGAGGAPVRSGDLAPAPAAPAVDDDVAVAPSAPAPAGPVPGSAPARGGAAPGGAAPGGAPGDVPVGADLAVRLVRVAGDQTAVLAVDGAVAPVRVGDGFGPGGSLLLLSVQQGPEDGQWTAVVQGGSGEPFDVVTGRPATVARPA